MTLLTVKHPQRDFFVPDMFDTIGASFKDDMASMEHPIFSLSKKTDMRILEYKKDNLTISVIPSVLGLPTIFDKDVLLYCMSQMIAEMNAGRVPPRTLRISSHDLLIATNRATNDDGYQRLQKALKRLRGVTITTNLKTNKQEIIKGFGVLDSYAVIESHKIKDRMIRLEITLSEWFYNSIVGKEVLTISRDYFRLGKPIERRLYEIVRKHCGRSAQWEIGLEKLMIKVGSTDTLRKFRLRIKEMAVDNHLPDYRFALEPNDKVVFWQKHENKYSEKNALPARHKFDVFEIRADTFNKAQKLVSEAGTGWDFKAILDQWVIYTEKTTPAKNKNAAFIGFVKKKIQSEP